jgi:hypothetical protein
MKLFIVMPVLVTGIHAVRTARMRGTSPRMTTKNH